MKYITSLLLLFFITACGDKIKNISKRQLVKSYKIAKDKTKPLDQRLTAFVFLKQKTLHTPLEEGHEIALFIKDNQTFFHEHLFQVLISKAHKSNQLERYLSSYDYQVNETIKLKKDISVFSKKPQEAKTIAEMQTAADQLSKSITTLHGGDEITVVAKIIVLKNDWLIIKTNDDKKYFCNSDTLKGTSYLKNILKAKAIWLADHYVKNYGNKGSYMYFTYLVEEFKLNVNRRLTSRQQYIHKAVQRGTEAKHFLQYLLKKGAVVNGITAFQKTPLDLAENNDVILRHQSVKPKDTKDEYKELQKQVKKREQLIATLRQNGAKTYLEIHSAKK